MKPTSVTPEDRLVDNIGQLAVEVRSKRQDKAQIEQTLDGLLSFCGFAPALELYRRLCRHYWDIDPVATAFYVDLYRTTWDADEDSQ